MYSYTIVYGNANSQARTFDTTGESEGEAIENFENWSEGLDYEPEFVSITEKD
jgi:hypothetical protein